MIISEMDTSEVIALLNDYYSVENTLRRRGFDIKEIEDTRQVIQTTDAFYKDFKSFSLRQILKLIYESDTGFSSADILGKLPNLTAESLSLKLDELINEKCITKEGDPPTYKKIKNRNHGRTFEWFVSEIVKREMCGISSSGVKVLNLKCGGDFDVISRLEDLLVHFECKSGSILNIGEMDITNFIGRHQELAPSLSVLVFDTNGLPADIKNRFLNADWKNHGLSPRSPKKRRIKGRGVFYELYPRVHAITSEGSLIANIKLSINHLFSFVKPYGLIAPGLDKLSKHYDIYES